MSINDLRAEVLKRHKAANNKVNRLKRQGVELSGTVYDVRRDPANVRRYNARQLQSYLGQLNDFMRRGNQFVAGNEGVPIRRGVWERYKRTEREYMDFVNQHYAAVKDTFVPRLGFTVEEFDRKVRPKRDRGKGGIPRPLEMFPEISAAGVVSEDRLEAIRQSLNKKLRPGFVPDLAKRQKFQILQSVAAFGDPEIDRLANDLTLDQVDTLFNYTDAPRDLFAAYRMAQLMAANQADEVDARILEDDRAEVLDWLKWAKTLPARK